MPNPEELIQALAELDPATLENVINTAYNRRRDPVRPARPDPVEGPGPFALARTAAHGNRRGNRAGCVPSDRCPE